MSSQRCLVFRQNHLGAFVLSIDDLAHLVVDFLGNGIGIIALFADFAAQENHLLLVAIDPRAQFVAHAILGHHRPGHFRDLLQVAAGPGRDFAKDDFFGNAAAQGSRNQRLKLGAAVEVRYLLPGTR